MFLGKSLIWWYWLATIPLLAYGVVEGGWGLVPVIALTAVQVMHFLVRNGKLSNFTVQVRIGYLCLLLFGIWEYGRFMLYLMLAGTCASVLVDYCLCARITSLMPWNRREPFTWHLIWRTFFSRPVKGSILQGLPPT